jgi:hypothetical protein
VEFLLEEMMKRCIDLGEQDEQTVASKFLMAKNNLTVFD